MGPPFLLAVESYDALIFSTALTLHLAAMAMWAGGNLFMNIILNPLLKLIPPQPSRLIANRIGERYTYYGWAALGLVASTGLFLTWRMGALDLAVLTTTTIGQRILALMFLTLVQIVNSSMITFYLTPRALSAPPGDTGRPARIEEVTTASRAISILSLVNAVLALASIAVGAAVRGGV